MNRKYAAWITHVAHHRIRLWLWRLAVSCPSPIRCCVRCPVTPFGFAGLAEVPDGNPRFLAPTVRPGRGTRFWLRRNDNFGQTDFVIRFSPVADVLCPSVNIKDQTDFRRRPAEHKPARQKSTAPITPFGALQKDGRLPSHARESYRDHIRTPSRFDAGSA